MAAVANVYFNGGRDFDMHVVRGTTSRTLNDDLVAEDDAVPSKAVFTNNLPAGWSVAFARAAASTWSAKPVVVKATCRNPKLTQISKRNFAHSLKAFLASRASKPS